MSLGTIFLTGATGYIGSRLLRELEAGGCAVRCLARDPACVETARATTEAVKGDCLDAASREAAANFGRAARGAGVRRIIYLGGLADDTQSLSTHLKSRIETGAVLRDSG